MKKQSHQPSRRKFLQQSTALLGGSILLQSGVGAAFAQGFRAKTMVVAHLWVYASQHPPGWDAYADLETIFTDLSYAGIAGVELMEPVLRHDDAVDKLKGLVKKYGLAVSGTSYGVGRKMWRREEHQAIMDDLQMLLPRLAQVGGKTFGISVGEAGRLKTEAELDAQADLLKKILVLCKEKGIEANLHNHTYEVENNLHDLKGTLARIPNIKLGPDLNWLIRAGVDPLAFIDTYGKQIVYLHIRDQYKDGTWTEFLGQGATAFGAIAAALKAQNFKGRAAIELAFPNGFKPTNPLREDWRLSRQFVKKTFGW